MNPRAWAESPAAEGETWEVHDTVGTVEEDVVAAGAHAGVIEMPPPARPWPPEQPPPLVLEVLKEASCKSGRGQPLRPGVQGSES